MCKLEKSSWIWTLSDWIQVFIICGNKLDMKLHSSTAKCIFLFSAFICMHLYVCLHLYVSKVCEGVNADVRYGSLLRIDRLKQTIRKIGYRQQNCKLTWRPLVKIPQKALRIIHIAPLRTNISRLRLWQYNKPIPKATVIPKAGSI